MGGKRQDTAWRDAGDDRNRMTAVLRARVVIIGRGIIGASTLYHLARLRIDDTAEVIDVDRFGVSVPCKAVLREYELTVDNFWVRAKALLS